ncbi:MAG: translation elongation factor Ts [Acidobacteria bacterium]|nr:MAG: translation elongation factor Ts [Acidobacteriota bacterium]
MAVPAEHVRKLREMTGAPMMECKKALEEANGDPELAFTILRKRGQASAAKKAGRTAAEGLVGYYIHPGSKIGVIVEVNCETDFVARTDEFQQLAHDLAMQICAAAPRFIRKEDVTPDVLEQERAILRDQAASSGRPPEKLDQIVEGKLRKFFEENCLYEQHFIKDPAGTLTVRELITSKIAKFGENITVRRYSRFKVGEGIGKAASESAPPGEVAQ